MTNIDAKVQPLHILFVELAQPDVQRIVDAIGYERFKLVWQHAQTPQARQTMLAQSWDIVFIGDGSPVADLLAGVRESGPGLPVVVVSRAWDAERAVAAIAAGASDVVCMDDLDRLHLMIARAVREAAADASAPGRPAASRLSERVIAASENGIIIVDARSTDLPITYANPAWCTLTGHPENSVIGHNLRMVYGPNTEPATVRQIERAFANATSANVELLTYRRDGSTFWAALSVTPMIDDGTLTHFAVFLQDASALKQVEAAMRHSEALWMMVFRASSSPMCVTHKATRRIMDANDGFLRLFGYERDDVIGCTVPDLQLWDDPNQHLAMHVQFAEDGYIRNYPMVARTNTGDLRHLTCSFDEVELQGEICVIASCFDMTERRRGVEALRESEERFRALFEGSPEGIVLLDPHSTDVPWKVIDANNAACKINGYERHELVGQSYEMLDCEQSSWSPVDDFLDRMRQGAVQGSDFHRRKDGTLVPIEYSATLVHIGGRELVLGIDRDITDRLRVEEALRSNEEYLRVLIENIADVIAVLEADGTVRYLSPSFRRVFEGSEITIGSKVFDIVRPSDVDRAREMFADLITTPGITEYGEYQVKHQRDGYKIMEVVATNLLDHPAVRGIVLNAHDMTDRKHMENRLAYDASHDALTGLANRVLFFERIGEAVRQPAWMGQHRCAVLFLDLDRFKTVNDSLGHSVGDELLVAVSKRLQNCVRPGDLVARFGGDEFAILIQVVTDPAHVAQTAERLSAAIEAPFAIAGQEIITSASIGIALCGADEALPEDLLRDADIAMYRAKRLGRGRHATVDPSMHIAIKERLHIEADLRRAVERDEFELYYQPKVAIDGRTIVGLEALVRWNHPERGLVPPAQFIPIAEDTGIIIALGEWVLRTACQQIKVWHDAGLPQIFVAVNLSAVQFRRADIAKTISAIIEDVGIEPRYVALELTESILMENVNTTTAALSELRNINIAHIAVDDFGTGYSSLNYLQRFPISAIKIDRSFICDVTTNAGSAAIASAIIALAHSLNLVTVAEGVETEEQRLWLEAHYCESFQGFLVSRPLPVAAMTRMLAISMADQTSTLVH